MGFKLKWFRHRLTFDQLPTSTSSASFSSSTSSSPTGLFRRSKSEAVIVTGYYRRSLDEELAENHAPREFPRKTHFYVVRSESNNRLTI